MSDPQRDLVVACAQSEPGDRSTWLILADWLEERGDERAHWLTLVYGREVPSLLELRAFHRWQQSQPRFFPQYQHSDAGWLVVRPSPRDLPELASLMPHVWPTQVMVDVKTMSECRRLLRWFRNPQIPPWGQIGLRIGITLFERVSTDLWGLPLRRLELLPDAGFEACEWNVDLPELPKLQSLSALELVRIAEYPLRQIWSHSNLRSANLSAVGTYALSEIPKWGAAPRWHSLEWKLIDRNEAWQWPSLPQLPDLRELRMTNCVSDLFSLAFAPNLGALEYHGLDEWEPANMEPIVQQSGLMQLVLGKELRFRPGSLARLGELPNLRELILRENRHLTDADLVELQACRQLETLDLTGCRQLGSRGLEAVAAIPSLRGVGLRDCFRMDRATVEAVQARRPDCQFWFLD
ncbi:leucine-rich repeat domain-containing protein [Tuwongella immobilis]|uniref:F-box and leucine-rich repeat protein 13 n=1 Tax=Tuwongella immobilis TaxID=692036 RepID=A0A6C2YTH5_9BACT|nr:leucine-rich repeat domain-containing protein [Tuwongella immobilis]VIP04714.1 F-box and leucine-rich repeat protein 13 OS=Tetraselmis sp. GSL018 GN=FBXL13 PE=4 SV=1 [Tuwongella immobilis]VTS06787.1 F-box and leucine-rich repeat protein 13 OS=Tetraselmis sp. GSL018 GN=FBXL13 PE=4 SV=1 [Tuwongella immobilis]